MASVSRNEVHPSTSLFRAMHLLEQGVLSEVGKASSGKLFPLLLQLLKENARLCDGTAVLVSTGPATPVPTQVRLHLHSLLLGTEPNTCYSADPKSITCAQPEVPACTESVCVHEGADGADRVGLCLNNSVEVAGVGGRQTVRRD